MNATDEFSVTSNIGQYYIACSLSASFGLVAVFIALLIIDIIRRTKPRLHTVRHLLMCNTSIASIFYCIVQTNNYIFLIFIPRETSDVGCHWRAYFAYVSIAANIYSYLVQAVSRFFFSVLSNKHRWLTTFKPHYVLIATQWIVVFVIALPAVVTSDIYFRPGLLCWVPLKYTLHLTYAGVAYCVAPITVIVGIYIFIYYRIRQARRQATILVNNGNDKRDLEVLRNIVILLGIYVTGIIPTLLFIATRQDFLYLAGFVTFSLVVMIEKIFTIWLDRELHQVVKGLVQTRARIQPAEH